MRINFSLLSSSGIERVSRNLSSMLGVKAFGFLSISLMFLMLMPDAFAHGVAEGDKAFLERSSGMQLLLFIYLGAKHMVTGYDHLLFLAGVIFFLYRMKDVGIYVTLFAVGHSVTLLYGVLSETDVNPDVPPYLSST